MRAGDVRCPECGAGLVNVAPDYDPFAFDPRSLLPWPPVSAAYQAQCASGHEMIIGTGREGHEGFSIMVFVPEREVAP